MKNKKKKYTKQFEKDKEKMEDTKKTRTKHKI